MTEFSGQNSKSSTIWPIKYILPQEPLFIHLRALDTDLHTLLGYGRQGTRPIHTSRLAWVSWPLCSSQSSLYLVPVSTPLLGFSPMPELPSPHAAAGQGLWPISSQIHYLYGGLFVLIVVRPKASRARALSWLASYSPGPDLGRYLNVKRDAG